MKYVPSTTRTEIQHILNSKPEINSKIEGFQISYKSNSDSELIVDSIVLIPNKMSEIKEIYQLVSSITLPVKVWDMNANKFYAQ